MGLAHSPSIVMNGLVLYLDAGNIKSYPGSGTAWTDLSSVGNNGTLTNGPTYSSSNGGSIVFDGSNDYTTIPHSTSLNLTETFTISSWINPTRTNTQDYICNKNNAWAIIIGYQSGFVNFYNGVYQPDSTSTQIPVTTNQWANIVYSKNLNSLSNNWVGYKNGSSIFSLTRSFTNNTNTDNFLIGSSTGSINFYQGNIAQVSIYNRALTASEIQQNFNALRGRFGI